MGKENVTAADGDALVGFIDKLGAALAKTGKVVSIDIGTWPQPLCACHSTVVPLPCGLLYCCSFMCLTGSELSCAGDGSNHDQTGRVSMGGLNGSALHRALDMSTYGDNRHGR